MFHVILVNPCATASLTVSMSPLFFEYEVLGISATYILPTLTSNVSNPICGPIVYELVDQASLTPTLIYEPTSH